MDLVKKKSELINLIMKCLERKDSFIKLQMFSWEMIDYFTKNKDKLPPYQDFEKEFWYAIWQMQHLADEEHDKDGLARKMLLDALDYLNDKKKMPESFTGMRP